LINHAVADNAVQPARHGFLQLAFFHQNGVRQRIARAAKLPIEKDVEPEIPILEFVTKPELNVRVCIAEIDEVVAHHRKPIVVKDVAIRRTLVTKSIHVAEPATNTGFDGSPATVYR